MNLFGFPRTLLPVFLNDHHHHRVSILFCFISFIVSFSFCFFCFSFRPTPRRMASAMGPPPPPNNPTTSDAETQNKISGEPSTSSSTEEFKRSTTMGPPPPPQHSSRPEPQADTGTIPDIEPEHLQRPKSPEKDASETASANSTEHMTLASKGMENSLYDVKRKKEQVPDSISVPYTIPTWSAPPCHQYFLEVLKDGSIIEQLDVNKKGAYMFGRVDVCDFVLEHPTISRFHAVIQFKSSGLAFLYDLGSTHGTFINKNQVKKKVYVELHVGDVIRFGHSSRLYIFEGPTDLMPPEADLKSIRKAKIQQEMEDMEASLQRAKVNATMADGISWGMQEDAIEENEDEVEEITWQTYKGNLTEKQEKTREKVLKRLEKVAHMKKEINAIQAKDIAQGGLTQGQQTQIARNEQRISQIMEELENLEETLNDSIRESIGARAGKTSHGKKKGLLEDDEDDCLSDDDEFYDRTQKHPKRKTGENQSIETADSLLDKKEALLKEIVEKKKLLSDEDRTAQSNEVPEARDALDAFMSGVSSQIATDKKNRLQEDLGSLQSELDRILYLLNIADPTGELAKKRESKGNEPTHNPTAASDGLQASSSSREQQVKNTQRRKISISDKSSEKQCTVDHETKSSQKLEESKTDTNAADKKPTLYTVAKPQWLGAVEDKKKQDDQVKRDEASLDMEENDEFVDYKDRKKILELDVLPEIENAAPGLIIRKRKHVEQSNSGDTKSSEGSKEAEREVEGAISLLLKHSRGYAASDEEPRHVNEDGSQGKKDKKKPKRVLGPEKPTFLSSETEYESWVPPQGQSGDGRTSLNDRYGY